MLMEQKRDDTITIRQLKKKYNKLLEKYLEKKKLLRKLATFHLNDQEVIERYKTEMKRLSNNNHQILKAKHNVEQNRDALKTKNFKYQLEVNNHQQVVHELQVKNVSFLCFYDGRKHLI